MNKFALKTIALIICLCGIKATVAFAQETKITVKTDYDDVCKVVLRPFSTFPMYIYADASLNEQGKGTITFTHPHPLFAEVAFTNITGRPMRKVEVYIEPGNTVKISVLKGENAIRPLIQFSGDLVQENQDLQPLHNLVFPLGIESEIEKDAKEAINSKSYSSQFKEQVQKVAHLISLEKQVTKLPKEDSEYKKILQELLKEVKQGNSWHSVFEWPRIIDNIFAYSEGIGLIKSDGDICKRMDYIGDEDIKYRYGVYKAERLVNRRDWFENPPTSVLEKLKLYMTTPEMKKELDEVLSKYKRICSEWEHFRTAPAPDFTYEDTEGNMVTLSDFRGKFVLLDVWNIYCGPCRNQVPILRKLEPQLKEMGVEVIGVSCDPQEIKDKWKKSVKDQNMSGIQTIMDNGRKSAFMNDYCIIGFPTFILINPEGMVVNPYMCRPENENEFMPYIKQKIEEYRNQ